MGLTYTDFVTDLANMLPVPETDPGFQTALPNIINDAELRAYRDLDLLDTVVRDTASTLTVSTRTFNLPSTAGTFVVTENFNVITPAGTTDPELGTRNSLLPVSKEMLDFLYPNTTGSTVPQYIAPISQTTFIVGPWPDAAYTVEVVGTIRPAPISVSNTTTLLSWYFPDLFMAAALTFASGYMKNFGAMVDDPKAAVTWESHYKTLLEGAVVEEARKKFTGAGWSSKQPAPMATPPRT